jgi:hypothetical protein
MVDEPGINDTPTTDEPGINDTPTTDEPGTNDTPTTDQPGHNDTPTVDEPGTSNTPTTDEPGTNDASTADKPVVNDTPMADKPITNDTHMADMNETPGNKNSQDQILIQDNSAVRTYKEDTSSTDSNGSPNALKVTARQKKKKKYRKKQNKTTPDTTKQLKRHSAIQSDFSGSDDNITLKELKIDIKRQKDESYSEIESVYDSRDLNKPCRDDYHSSDSNLPLQSIVGPKLSFWISTWFILELSFLGSELSLLIFCFLLSLFT